MTKSEIKSFLPLSFAIVPIGNLIACMTESIRLNQKDKTKTALILTIGMVMPIVLLLLKMGFSNISPWDINLIFFEDIPCLLLAIILLIFYVSSIIYTVNFFKFINSALTVDYQIAVWFGLVASCCCFSVIIIFQFPFREKDRISYCYKPNIIRYTIPKLLMLWGAWLLLDFIFYDSYGWTLWAYLFIMSLYGYEFAFQDMIYLNDLEPQPIGEKIDNSQNEINLSNLTMPTAQNVAQETYYKGWKNDDTTQMEINRITMFDVLYSIELANKYEKRVVLFIERIYPYVIEAEKNKKTQAATESFKIKLAEIKLECVRHIYRQGLAIAIEDYNKVPNV